MPGGGAASRPQHDAVREDCGERDRDAATSESSSLMNATLRCSRAALPPLCQVRDGQRRVEFTHDPLHCGQYRARVALRAHDDVQCARRTVGAATRRWLTTASRRRSTGIELQRVHSSLSPFVIRSAWSCRLRTAPILNGQARTLLWRLPERAARAQPESRVREQRCSAPGGNAQGREASFPFTGWPVAP
jgi:hypothetical protein